MQFKYAPYSHSRLLCGLCPWAFSRHYIEKVPEVGSQENLMVGGIAHEIAEYIGNHPNEAIVPDMLVNQFITPFVSHRHKDLTDWTRLFLSRFKYSQEHVVGIEMDLAVDRNTNPCDYDSPDAIFRGKLDMVEIDGHTARVTDYKTQMNILNREKIDDHFQLSLYAWMLHKKYPHLKEIYVQIYYMRYGFAQKSIRPLELLADVQKELKLRIMAIENYADFKPRPCEFCSICSYKTICPVLDEIESAGFPVIREVKDRTVIAGRYLMLTELLKEYKKVISDDIGANGAISVPGIEIGFYPNEKTEWPTQKTMNVLARHDVDPYEIAKFGATAMKSYLRENANPELKKDLDNVKEISMETKFKSKKVRYKNVES